MSRGAITYLIVIGSCMGWLAAPRAIARPLADPRIIDVPEGGDFQAALWRNYPQVTAEILRADVPAHPSRPLMGLRDGEPFGTPAAQP